MDDRSAAATMPGRQTELALHGPREAVNKPADEVRGPWRQWAIFTRQSTGRGEEITSRRVEGEARLARCFDRLGTQWRMLHAVTLGEANGDIDHLLIGPKGVYSLNSRHHAAKTVCLGGDTLMVDGRRVHHIRESRREAALASRLLTDAVGFDVPVMGVVVILGDRRFDVRQPQDGSVFVTTPQASTRWLASRDLQWTSWAVERIYEHARRSSTWGEATGAQMRATLGPPSSRMKTGSVSLSSSQVPSGELREELK